jgi:hypothetical protein
MVEMIYSDIDFTVLQCVIKSSHLLQWFRHCSGLVCHQIIYSLQCVHMHLINRILLQPPTCCYQPSSHFTHTLSLPSCTTLLNMPQLPDPRMERASILLLWSTSKAYHLFNTEHIWKEMLGVFWHWPKWHRRLLYLHFIHWWLHLKYYYYGLI